MGYDPLVDYFFSHSNSRHTLVAGNSANTTFLGMVELTS